MAKRFVTLFPIAKNTHLIKDVGQIPCFMATQHGYRGELACYNNDEHYHYTETEAKGLSLTFLEPSGKRLFLENAAIEFLHREAKNIDILNLYHLDRDTFYYGNLYKKLNPTGTLYCKLDLYNQFLEHGKKRHSINVFKNLAFRRWERKFIRNVDLFSVENRTGLELMKRRYPACVNKIIYLPNGVNSPFIDSLFKEPVEKEKLIVVMSRIGETIKNHEILLRVLPLLDLKGWEIAFVGPVVKRFTSKIEAFYHEFPHLRTQVKFVGEASDRKTVYDWFRRARVTCLTSLHESFGIAFVEALYFGNYLIGTEGMSSFSEISNDGKYGEVLPFNDDDRLAKTLQSTIDNPARIDALRSEAEAYGRAHFTWPVLVKHLHDELIKRSPDGNRK